MTATGQYLAMVRREAQALGYPHWQSITTCGWVYDCHDFGKPARVCAQKFVDDYNRVVLGK